jgi:hypothetical protein
LRPGESDVDSESRLPVPILVLLLVRQARDMRDGEAFAAVNSSSQWDFTLNVVTASGRGLDGPGTDLLEPVVPASQRAMSFAEFEGLDVIEYFASIH